MENKAESKNKSRNYDESRGDEFILNLVDVNAGFDLKEASEKD